MCGPGQRPDQPYVLAVWLAAAIAAIVVAQASGGKTNDTFTIPGSEAQNVLKREPRHQPLVVRRCWVPRSGGTGSVDEVI
jgi:hypothetical protein